MLLDGESSTGSSHPGGEPLEASTSRTPGLGLELGGPEVSSEEEGEFGLIYDTDN